MIVVFAAFAELQTDMTQIVGNISGPAGLPYHNYSGFCVRCFFPGVPANSHSVLRSLEVSFADFIIRNITINSKPT